MNVRDANMSLVLVAHMIEYQFIIIMAVLLIIAMIIKTFVILIVSLDIQEQV